MSLKKKRKKSCPFASANRADVLATIVIKNKIDGRTIPFVPITVNDLINAQVVY